MDRRRRCLAAAGKMMWPTFSALEPFEALDANWRETLRGQTRSLVFWWASWSPPDEALANVLARVVPDYVEQFAFFTADVEEESLIPMFMEMKAFTTPQLVLFEGDTLVNHCVGYANEEDLRAWLGGWLQR